MRKRDLIAMIDKMGQRYSEILDIDIESGDDGQIFKWFLASILFAAPINESSAIKTYRCFEKHEVLTPKKIVETGWDSLVRILDEGGYTRYDYKTADKLLLVMGNFNSRYGGSLNRLHSEASDSVDLEKRLRELGKGIGDVTVSIFLRELRGVWSKADPKPTQPVITAANSLHIIRSETPEEALLELKRFWKKSAIKGKSFVNFETALFRYSKEMQRKKAPSADCHVSHEDGVMLIRVTTSTDSLGMFSFFCHSSPTAIME